MYGWMDKYLKVNLSTGEIKVEELNAKDAEDYLGQRGLGTKMVIDLIPDPAIDALSPENPLAFVAGPLTGLFGVSNGRFEVVTKSPLTGTIAASNSGGFWGPELKYAGYEAIIFEGKSEKPVYLWVNDDKVELRDASHLWGKDTFETTELVKKETNEEAKVCCIGPAGEKLSRIACVMNDMYRSAARSGVGAVMGSKNLKAVVVRGTGEIKIADPENYFRVINECRQKVAANGDVGGALTKYGTMCLANAVGEAGGTPVKNFGPQSGFWEHTVKTSGEVITEKYLVKSKGCFNCIIACARVSRVPQGKFQTPVNEGCEYETGWGFTANMLIDDVAVGIKANYLCNKIGVDTISMAGTISCAMEMYELGYITEKDTGMPIRWGDGEVVMKLIEMTGTREGFGDKLAEGSYRMAEAYGHPECSVTVKKQEFPGYDPRAAQGTGLSYATSNRGACHVRTALTDFELVSHLIPQETTEGKAQVNVDSQDFMGFVDSVGMCLFPTNVILEDDIAAMLKYATGVDYTGAKIMEAGARIWNLERLFNLKAGVKPEEDTLPRRLLEVPLGTGAMKGHVTRLHEMLPEYYALRGWDEKGIPKPEKIKELGLENCKKVL